jgi:hypothetical protein
MFAGLEIDWSWLSTGVWLSTAAVVLALGCQTLAVGWIPGAGGWGLVGMRDWREVFLVWGDGVAANVVCCPAWLAGLAGGSGFWCRRPALGVLILVGCGPRPPDFQPSGRV